MWFQFGLLIRDIDEALRIRAENAIADAQEISLTLVASKAESQARAYTEWENKQAKLNKKILDCFKDSRRKRSSGWSDTADSTTCLLGV
jgi:hypothetical protein